MRGLPALVYLKTVGRTQTLAAGLLQATSLPLIVTASSIGVEVGTSLSVVTRGYSVSLSVVTPWGQAGADSSIRRLGASAGKIWVISRTAAVASTVAALV